MERCAHSGPEANDGPCTSCAGGPAPLPPDAGLSYSQRFGQTEWGIPQLPTEVEISFVTTTPGRKWTSVVVAFGIGVAVVIGLTATMLVGNPNAGRRPLTGANTSPRTAQSAPAASATPAGQKPAATAKPKPGRALRDAMVATLAQPGLGFHADYTITITATGYKRAMSGDMDLAGQSLAANLRFSGGAGTRETLAGEYVIKDGEVYNRETGKVWQRAASAVQLPSDPFPSSDALRSLEYVGVRTVKGKKLHLFRGTAATLIQDGALRNGLLGVADLRSVRYDVLVTADGIPVRITATTKFKFTQDGKTRAATMDLDYRISRFGKPVDITTPTVGAAQSG